MFINLWTGEGDRVIVIIEVPVVVVGAFKLFVTALAETEIANPPVCRQQWFG